MDQYCKKSRNQRQPRSNLCTIIFFLLLLGRIHGSRTSSNTMNTKTEHYYYRGHFTDFLPRHLHIPASGPSRRHNGIGLQAWRSP
ncbi:Protein IDA-LIKE 4 [Linum perenne]